MSADIKKIGELLKKRREEMQFSIKEIESSTSIRSSYLEAIENGLNEKFLSNVYMFGFIRQYASFLGLDVQSLVKQFPEAFNSTEIKHDFVHGIGTLEVRNTMTGGIRSFSNIIWAMITALGILLFWYIAKAFGWI